ncbi:hypothetical protein [Roseateles sp.]|uniref:hypothetical protein n=1 Tax=Roseateles sp. TaxID=1971397 RepID=UPI003925C38B
MAAKPRKTPVAATPAAAPTKPTAKRSAAAKAPTKAAPKPAAKAAAKPAAPAKSAAPKRSAKPAPAPAVAKPKPDATTPKTGKKQPKPRPVLVRDSFTMPESDFALIDTLKATALRAHRAAKKSELLRAGLQLLATLEAEALAAALGKLEHVKTGRPKKGH